MQNFVNAIPPLNFLVCALLLSVSIWLIQSWIRCFAHSNFHPPYSFVSFASTILRFLGYATAIPRIIGAFNGTNSIEEISQALKANDFYAHFAKLAEKMEAEKNSKEKASGRTPGAGERNKAKMDEAV